MDRVEDTGKISLNHHDKMFIALFVLKAKTVTDFRRDQF